jgi:hypothetical protein
LTINGGTPSVQAFSPFLTTTSYDPSLHGGSAYFDGTGDYLSAPSNSAFAFGTGNFTLECWIYVSSPSDTPIYEGRTSGDSSLGFTLTAYSSTVIRIFCGSVLISATVANYTNQWTHVAVVKNSGTTTLYVNGVSGGTTASLGNLTDTQPLIGAGRYTSSASPSAYMLDYISNFRIVKGTAVYTGNFTPPTSQLTAIANTSLLANFTNAGIIDQSGKNNLETVGNAQVSTAVKKYGSTSMYFDGTGDYLSILSSPNLNFGTGDFTIEFWFYAPAQGTTRTAFIGADVAYGANFWTIQLNNTSPAYSSRIQLWCYNMNAAAVVAVGSTTLSVNTWYHVAVVRNGSAITIYVNGTSDGTATSSASLDGGVSQAISIAKNSTDYYTGYIDDLRITKGVARYTSNFTAPISTFVTK